MPCRSAAPEVDTRYPSATSPPSTVGPAQPGLGCAAPPTGLSTTMISSSACSTVSPATTSSGPVMGVTGSGSGSCTSSHEPALSRSDLPAARPSTATRPSSVSAATAVRERPSSRDRPASTRMPSRPSGTGSWRVSLTGRLARPGPRAAAPRAVELPPEQGEQHEQHTPGDDRGVGEVEHRPDPPVGGEEGYDVDDVAVQRARRAEQ